MDIDTKAVEALRRGGFEAYAASALEFDPGDVDILIMLNPQISPDVPGSHVVDKGFVLSNDYHGTASSLRQNSQYQLRAMIRMSPSKELIWDIENLEDCWKEVDTEEGFKNAPFDWEAANYAGAVAVVEAVTGKRKNVLAEYKKIIEMARAQQRQDNARVLTKHPEWAESVGDPDKDGVMIFNYKGRQFILSTILPRKKGTVDDIFIFQKVKQKSGVSEASVK